jgi:hypothetical protein
MATFALEEIEIPDCYQGRVWTLNVWRLAVAEMTGVPIRYVTSVKAVSLTSKGPMPAPARLPFIEAMVTDATFDEQMTPARRLGQWDTLPSEPLWILLMLTLPGSVIRSRFAEAIADRLRDITELMYGIDDGSRGMVDLGRFTRMIEIGMRQISDRRTDAVVQGGYEPSGWWDVEGAFSP